MLKVDVQGFCLTGSLQINTVPSPATLVQNQLPIPQPSLQQNAGGDDREYMEKLKQLQKYIEPLSRMINKVNEKLLKFQQTTTA